MLHYEMNILESNIKTALEHWASKFILFARLKTDSAIKVAIYFGKDSCNENCYSTKVRNNSDYDKWFLCEKQIHLIWETVIFS